MNPTQSVVSQRFPRAWGYHPEWVLASVSGGANPLWLTEWLTEAVDLRPGMRVLDLGCGRAVSSIFLRREFDVQVWATDLWFSAEENLQRIQDAGVGDGVFPIHADARSLPFAAGFFDVITSIDSFVYYGTDDLYLKETAGSRQQYMNTEPNQLLDRVARSAVSCVCQLRGPWSAVGHRSVMCSAD